nr:DUF4215 domain-containing protein [Kofleriaceae bacterium]
MAALLAGLAATDSAALVHHGGLDQQKVATGRQPRLHRALAWGTHASLPGWRVQWDRDTDTPAQMFGPNVVVSGSVADGTVAEAAARAFLAQHLGLLAPGASASDFVLLANRVDDDIRSVTFEQRASGLRVDGAAIGFSFKRDHLTLISSTALPNARVVVPSDRIPRTDVAAAATAWLGRAGHVVAARDLPVERVVVPLIHPHNFAGVDIDFRVAEQISVEATQGTGRWDVFVDARDGSAFARRNTLRYAVNTGTLQFDVPDHDPSHTRGVVVAPNDTITVNSASVTTDGSGAFTFAGASPGTLVPAISGPFVTINNFSGTNVTDSLQITAGSAVTWDQSATISNDAQLDAFVYASRAKTFAKTRVNPSLPYWDQNLSVTTNETDQGDCNAFSTGDDIHFFPRGSVPNGDGTNFNCENTGRISDVVFHEFGHSVHFQSIIPGMGQFDSSLSEGLADSFANNVTGDHGVGVGFDLDHPDVYLRDEGSGVVKRWPQDADGEPHDEGEIIAESYIGIRTALQAKLGSDAGYDQAIKIYYSIVQRSPGIPESITPALIGDDDDGDLTNGTPNECEIQQQMNIHGLGDPSFTIVIPPPVRAGLNVTETPILPTQSFGCAFPTVVSSSVAFHVRGGDGTDTTMALADNGSGGFAATLPGTDGQTVLYKVTTTLSDGSTFTYPDNKADPYYEAYVGAVTNIQCFDFEAGSDGWVKSGTLDEWAFGAPKGLDTDPPAAFDGSSVAGIDLANDGDYSPSSNQTLTSPAIALGGHTQVHLQYYRWLGVEDGAYDHATITANGSAVWNNLTSPGQPDPGVEINHLDKEWVFEDVDLTAVATAAGGSDLTLAFHLDSDPGLEFGGWTIDDVCVVAIGSATAGAVCGNGIVEAGETCDDGNTTDGDGCSSTCQTETGGGGGGKADGGCCSTGGSPATPAALGLLVLGLVVRRRRAARA